tara:strand:+ start:63 stop:281 length:219 start_codon:yes stop_codon:yes gene_type:complete
MGCISKCHERCKDKAKIDEKWSLRLTNKYLALIDNPVTATPIDFQQPVSRDDHWHRWLQLPSSLIIQTHHHH